MTIVEWNEELQSIIEKAIRVGNGFPGENMHLSLNIDCMEDLDHFVELLRNLYQKREIDDDFAWQLSISIGALLGEIIRTKHSMIWKMDADIPVLALRNNTNNSISPITKIYKIITSEDDVEGRASSFYNGLLALLKYGKICSTP